MHGNVRDDPVQHQITLTSVHKITQDFFDNLPKVNDPTILEFIAMFSAWIRVLRCGKLQIKSYKCEKKPSLNFCTSGAGAKDSEEAEYWL